MIFNNIYSAVIICLFIAFIGIVISFYIDYRKNYRQVTQIYAILTNQQLLKKKIIKPGKILGSGDLVSSPQFYHGSYRVSV